MQIMGKIRREARMMAGLIGRCRCEEHVRSCGTKLNESPGRRASLCHEDNERKMKRKVQLAGLLSTPGGRSTQRAGTRVLGGDDE